MNICEKTQMNYAMKYVSNTFLLKTTTITGTGTGIACLYFLLFWLSPSFLFKKIVLEEVQTGRWEQEDT